MTAKDEFFNIKNVSADDMLVIHRVPPKLMDIIPKSASSIGDARTDAEVFATNGIIPLQQQFLSVNEKFKLAVFKFKPYQIGKI